MDPDALAGEQEAQHGSEEGNAVSLGYAQRSTANELIKESRVWNRGAAVPQRCPPPCGEGTGVGFGCITDPTRRASRGDLPTRGRYRSKRHRSTPHPGGIRPFVRSREEGGPRSRRWRLTLLP